MNTKVVETPDIATQGPSDRRGIAVAFMFASMGVMVITLVMTLFFQSEWSYAVCIAIYGAKVAAELKFGIKSPLSMSILVVYVAMLCAVLAGVDYSGYGGIIIFSWLFVVVGFLLAIGRPFTTFYSHGLGLPSLHRTVSVLWLIAYGTALTASITLMPHPMFVVLPALLCLGGGVSTVFVSFVWCGRSNERKQVFKNGAFEFRQISRTSIEFDEFCEFYARHIVNDPRQSAGSQTWQEVAEGTRRAEEEIGKESIVFVCKVDGRVVGCIRCVLDRPGRPFAVEKYMKGSYDGLRKYGNLMVVGRLVVDEAYRSRPDIMNGLFSAFVNLALERDISYVLADGFEYVLPIYLKLGFQMLFPKTDRRYGVKTWSGFISHPVIFNFEHFVLTKARAEDMKFGLYEMASKYIAERWYKRTTIRLFFNRLRGRALLVDIQDIRRALAEPALPVEVRAEAPAAAADVRA